MHTYTQPIDEMTISLNYSYYKRNSFSLSYTTLPRNIYFPFVFHILRFIRSVHANCSAVDFITVALMYGTLINNTHTSLSAASLFSQLEDLIVHQGILHVIIAPS